MTTPDNMTDRDRPIIWYDMTNLVKCVQKPTPTGIDRIDLIYACFLMKLAWVDLHPVYVKENSVHLIPLERLKSVVSRLRRIWLSREIPGVEGGIFKETWCGVMLRLIHRMTQVKSIPDGKGIYINISQRNLASKGVAEWIKLKSSDALCMIHDLLPISHAEYFDEHASQRHSEKLKAMLGQQAVFICGSQACLSELDAFAKGCGFENTRMLKMPFGTKRFNSNGSAERAAGFPPYFLTLGTFEPRKNHQFIIRVWLKYMSKYGAESTPDLFMLGRRGRGYDGIRQIMSANPELAGKVHVIFDASDAEIHGFMKSAQALLIPSIAEGYGLPLYEAFSVGTPVIASGIDVFKELSRDIARLLPLDDENEWAEALHHFVSSGEMDRQKTILKKWQRPTWAAHARGLVRHLSEPHARMEAPRPDGQRDG